MGNAPAPPARKLAPLLESSMIVSMDAVVSGEPRDAIEGKWTLEMV